MEGSERAEAVDGTGSVGLSWLRALDRQNHAECKKKTEGGVGSARVEGECECEYRVVWFACVLLLESRRTGT
jgi:hypothetical protein